MASHEPQVRGPLLQANMAIKSQPSAVTCCLKNAHNSSVASSDCAFSVLQLRTEVWTCAACYKKSLKGCYLQHFAVHALRAYFTATYYGKASGRQNALCAFRSSFCRVWGGGGGQLRHVFSFSCWQMMCMRVCVCVYMYVYIYICIYIDVYIYIYTDRYTYVHRFVHVYEKQEMKLLA